MDAGVRDETPAQINVQFAISSTQSRTTVVVLVRLSFPSEVDCETRPADGLMKHSHWMVLTDELFVVGQSWRADELEQQHQQS